MMKEWRTREPGAPRFLSLQPEGFPHEAHEANGVRIRDRIGDFCDGGTCRPTSPRDE
jgi:hypothetical protein